MSADNWRICPKCLKQANAKIANVENEYGQIQFCEFAKLWEKAKENEILESTLREDFECFTDENGLLSIKYTCKCTVCDFEHNFTHTEPLLEGMKDENKHN